MALANHRHVGLFFRVCPAIFLVSLISRVDSVGTEKIRDLVFTEDSEKPLSDQKIVQLLKDEGLPIARRTVAKYREELGIPASHLRKEFE